MCWYVLSRLCVGVEAQCVKVVVFVQEYVVYTNAVHLRVEHCCLSPRQLCVCVCGFLPHFPCTIG